MVLGELTLDGTWIVAQPIREVEIPISQGRERRAGDNSCTYIGGATSRAVSSYGQVR
jgi:hypothetical protein